MRFFADLEFTAFRDPRMKALGFPYSPNAKMLSAGLVGEDGRELYIEVRSPELESSASDFVLFSVLPQFGLHPAVRVDSSKEAGNVLADFLSAIPGDLVICADYEDDLQFLIEALNESGRDQELRRRLKFEQVQAVVCAPGTESLWDAAFEQLEGESGLSRHHALLDARALKAVYTSLIEYRSSLR
jgi:hypothetical protein